MPFDPSESPSLAVLGWDALRVSELASLSAAHGVELTPARVARVDRGALTVLTGSASMRVRPSSRLFELDAASEPIGTPAVGDWVALDGPVAVDVLSRRSTFERSSSDRATVAQVVAANVDTVFVVLPLVGRQRPRLLQRCLAMAWQSGATPVVLLTKSDVATDASERVAAAQVDAVGVEVVAVSAATGDGIDALMKMIANENGCASKRIFNVGNPANSLSVRELAEEMLRLAATYPEYRANAAKVKLVETTAAEYYGKGYQDVEFRTPKIDNTKAELGWTPRVTMQDALRQIFDAYKGEIAQAGRLLD